MLGGVAERASTLGPAGDVLRANLRRIREGQRLSYPALSARMAAGGRALPPLTLARTERGRRQVDVDDLLVYAVAYGVAPVDLLVPGVLADDAPWRPVPAVSLTAGRARAWIGGRALLQPPATAGELYEVLRWMPQQRAREVADVWGRTTAGR